MQENVLSAREIKAADIDLIAAYWSKNDNAYYESMGVDVKKLPQPAQLKEALLLQIATPVNLKTAYCIIWELAGKTYPDEHLLPRAIGHCNVSPINFGEEAYMHLHLWDSSVRNKGMGTTLVKLALPYFFNNLRLKKLYCQPYALNDAPNKTLQRVGFAFDKEYITIPGPLNFEQPVKRWMMTREMFDEMLGVT